MKLEAPKSRNGLRAQTQIWKKVIEKKHIIDLYTGLDLQKIITINLEY